MSSFIDNPVVSSLAGALGLGGLTQAGNTNPLVAAATTTPKVAPTHSAPNQPEYRQARFFDPRAPQGSGGSSQGTGMPLEPGAMSPDVQNNPTVMDLLNHFGVHPQQEVDPNLFIHNAQAWANHPVMSGVLEGALSGLANTKGSDTVGEGLSNVAQGFAATQAQRTQRVNAQLQMPYQQAMTIASLQDQVDSQKFKQAQAQHDQAMSDYYNKLPGINEAIQSGHDQTKLAVEGEKQKGLLARQQEREKAQQVIAGLKPPNATNDAYQKAYNGHLAEMTKGRDLSQEDQQPSAVEMMQAALAAQKDLVGAGSAKVQGQVAVKGATPGSSAAAMISANKSPDAQTKAVFADADNDVKQWQKMTPSQKRTALGKIVIPGDENDTAELKRRMAVRDAALKNLPGPGGNRPASSPAPRSAQPQITHRYNPVTQKIEAVSGN